MSRYRYLAKKRSLTACFPAGVVALFLLTGCSPPDVSPGKPLAEHQVEAAVETFFEYLEEGQPGAAMRMTNLAGNAREARGSGALLEEDVYAESETRPTLDDATTRWVRPPLALVDVTYTMGETELHDAVLVHELERVGGEKVASVGGFRIELADGAFGIDVDGVQYLPEDTKYSIFGEDVTAAIKEVAGDPDLTPSEKFVLPAFGGTYELEIDVPGEDGFKETVTIETVSFYGVSREPGLIIDVAEEHDFTEMLWH